MQIPETRYAKSGDVHIAYQVVGEGSFDLVYVPGFVSNVEEVWEEPHARRFLERLASFSRLILFDKRGTGLSDPVPLADLPTLEQRPGCADKVRARSGLKPLPPAPPSEQKGATEVFILQRLNRVAPACIQRWRKEQHILKSCES